MLLSVATDTQIAIEPYLDSEEIRHAPSIRQ